MAIAPSGKGGDHPRRADLQIDGGGQRRRQRRGDVTHHVDGRRFLGFAWVQRNQPGDAERSGQRHLVEPLAHRRGDVLPRRDAFDAIASVFAADRAVGRPRALGHDHGDAGLRLSLIADDAGEGGGVLACAEHERPTHLPFEQIADHVGFVAGRTAAEEDEQKQARHKQAR
ncbi:MAG: hypothetical protein R2873_07895 [Caldilineaceae bacterium]